MENTPQFRHRVLPMPKVGDEVHIMGFHMSAVPGVVTAVDYGKRTFNVNTDGTEMGHCLAFEEPRWNFADPAVEAQRLMEAEAQRLMEAAYRADTSPFPPDVLTAIEEEKGDIYMAMRRMTSWFVQEDDMETIADNWPHLLRWQAQQEGGKNA